MRPLWLPSALAYVAFGVLTIKLVGIGISLSAGGALAAESCGPLSAVLYDLAPPLCWGALCLLLALPLAWAFVRQVRLGTPTKSLFAAAAAVTLFFAFLAAVLAYEVGGFCSSSAMAGGAAALAYGLATEGLPHPLFGPPARLFGLVKTQPGEGEPGGDDE